MFSFSELSNYKEAFWRLIFPASCGLCPCVLELAETSVCTNCRLQLELLRYSYMESLSEEKIPFIHQSWALYRYESPLRELFAAIKFSNKRWLLEWFRSDLEKWSEVLESLGKTYDGVIPIPIDRWRLANRHFNQSEILARDFADFLQVPFCSFLSKNRSTLPQHLLDRHQRQWNLKGIFKVKSWWALRGKRFLLVDDIQTTGATASEAARVLKEQGAAQVDLITLARTPLESTVFAGARS